MKILLIHYRYRFSGGPELYLKKIIEYLNKNGHEVDIFSINWNDNEIDNRSDWYTPNVSNSNFSARNSKGGLISKLVRVPSMIYNKNVKSALENKILVFKPDIAYVLLFMGKLTASIFDSLSKYNIPFFVRISDFSSVCQNSILLRKKSIICTKCVSDGPINGVYNLCGGSIIESSVHFALRLSLNRSNYRYANGFIAPSKNTIDILSKSSLYKYSKFHYIPTFSPIEPGQIVDQLPNKITLAYWGRISEEKAVLEVVLLFKELSLSQPDWSFKIIGFDNSLYSEKVKSNALMIDRCQLFDFMNLSDLLKTITDVNYFITSTKIVDNFPQSAVVALSQGIKVILPNIGSYKEVIDSDKYGLLFDDMKHIKDYILNDNNAWERNDIINYYKHNFGAEKHLQKLQKIFEDEIKKNS